MSQNVNASLVFVPIPEGCGTNRLCLAAQSPLAMACFFSACGDCFDLRELHTLSKWGVRHLGLYLDYNDEV